MNNLALALLAGISAAAALPALADESEDVGLPRGWAQLTSDPHGYVYSNDRQGDELRAAIHAKLPNAAGASPNVDYHGGPILISTRVDAIFWGKSWPGYKGDKFSGIDTYYEGFGGSNYAKTVTEYTGTNGAVSATVAYGTHYIDGSASISGDNGKAILAEVCKVIAGEHINPPTHSKRVGYYPVYTDYKRGNAGYCAWHASGTCGGTEVTFSYFFDPDGDDGCSNHDTSGLHSPGLSDLGNSSAHELSEARTDPYHGDGWYNNTSGKEVGDLCAHTFDVPLVTFTNGSQWKVQGEWSNRAYNSGTGYPNKDGQKGCLSGE
ncbi:MAG: hypothetical protein P4L83_00345 [Nevskia sp.]|nr:hypothetical protein [Nevskia sp.]